MATESHSDNIDKEMSKVNIDNVEGDIRDAKIAGRDVIDVIIQIVQQTGLQIRGKVNRILNGLLLMLV